MQKVKYERAGYSGKTLSEKLGIKPDQRILVSNPPKNIHSLIPLNNYNISNHLSGEFNLILFFTQSSKTLIQKFISYKRHLIQNGSLWICWPKKSSRLPSDLNENIIREIGIKNGLVDVKVCAVDDNWSGLKFVFRLKNRK